MAAKPEVARAGKATPLRRILRSGVPLYLALAFGLAWESFFALRALGAPVLTLYVPFALAPAIAALLVRGPLRHEGFADAGLRVADSGRLLRDLATAYGVVPVLITSGVALTWLAGLRGTGPTDFDQPFLEVALLVLLGPILFTPLIVGEEVGWRGYLLPRLAPMGGLRAVLTVGVVWGTWHAPLIVYLGAGFPEHRVLGVAAMILMTSAFGAVLAWLRFRSGSIWPACLAHAGWNAQGGIWLVNTGTSDSLAVVCVALVPTIAFAAWLAITGRLEPPAEL